MKEPRDRPDEMGAYIARSFKDNFPCVPRFFSWKCLKVDLAKIDATELAMEINRHLVERARQGVLYQMDVPFTYHSALVGEEIEVRNLLSPSRAMQEVVKQLLKHRNSQRKKP